MANKVEACWPARGGASAMAASWASFIFIPLTKRVAPQGHYNEENDRNRH